MAYNKVILIGRLTADPEFSQSASGVSFCKFSIAVDRSYSKGQEKQTDFFRVSAFRQTAEFVNRYFNKGKLILVEGKIQNNNYTDQNGIKHVTELKPTELSENYSDLNIPALYLKKFNGAKAPPLWGKGGIFTAERRMFSKTIIDSDLFLDMPQSTQLLYFHLSMRADDDGFINNPKKIMRMVNCSEDDMKILIAKRFIIPFESGIVVIRHWKIHNYIRSDRYKPSTCEEKNLVETDKNMVYQMTTNGIPSDNQAVDRMDTQDRIGKVRLSKDRSGKESATDVVAEPPSQNPESIEDTKETIPYQEIKELFNNICISYSKVRDITERRRKAIRARFNDGYTLEDFKKAFEIAEESDFLKGNNGRNWKADFDWFTNESNLTKTLEGKYDNRKQQPVKQQNPFSFNDELEEKYGI